MVMFIAFVIAILSAAACGYLLGNGRATGRNNSTDTSDATANQHVESVTAEGNAAVSTGAAASQTIQDIITGIRRGSGRSDSDDDSRDPA